MARETRKRIVSKKHLARLDRERRQTRYILGASAVVVAIALAFVLYGVVDLALLRPNKAVATVDGEKITVREFQAYARYYRFTLYQNWNQSYQFMQQFGSDASFQQYFASSLTQIKNQMDDKETLGQQVVDMMTEDIFIRKEAERLGLTPDKAAVEKEVEEFFGFYENGTPTPEPTFEMPATATFSPAQVALLATSTPTVTVEITATATPEIVVTPELTITEATATPTLAPEPTATPYTREAYVEESKTYLDGINENFRISESTLRYIIETQLLRELVMDAVTADLPREQEQVWARHILIADEATAQEVLLKLQEGENFIDLAAQYSIDGSASTGGDLGWFTREDMVTEFSDAAFALEVGEISQPVLSENGYHIIQVIDHQVLPLSDDKYQTLKESNFQAWLDTQREAADIEVFSETVTAVVPDDPTVPDINQILQQQQQQQFQITVEP